MKTLEDSRDSYRNEEIKQPGLNAGTLGERFEALWIVHWRQVFKFLGACVIAGGVGGLFAAILLAPNLITSFLLVGGILIGWGGVLRLVLAITGDEMTFYDRELAKEDPERARGMQVLRGSIFFIKMLTVTSLCGAAALAITWFHS